MRFVFACPTCKARIEADSGVSGQQSPCPQCGNLIAVPESRVDCGSTLGGFRLERRLGKGGMGEVFLATQLSVKRQVAVKVLPPGFAGNTEAVHRFLHEGQLAAKLDHANIVTVFEAGEDNGTFYLAMAYIEGESLDQRLRRDRVVPEAEALAIVRSMADALAYAWDEFQLLHRDIKPANIMVDRRGRVFLMDLGLAKSLGEETGLTLSGSILGTPQYMSPEQAQGLSDLGVPTDVYSLGATLYHLVTGAPPFAGDSALKVLHQHVHEPLPPPRSRNPGLSEGCGRLLERMLAKRSGERYGDWRDLAAEIDRVRAGAAPLEAAVPAGNSGAPAVAVAASRADLARQAQEALARQHPAEARPAPAASRRAVPASTARRRPSPLVLAMAAAAVLVLVLVGAVALRGRGKPAALDRTDRTDQSDRTDRQVKASPASAVASAALAPVDPGLAPSPPAAQEPPSNPAVSGADGATAVAPPPEPPAQQVAAPATAPGAAVAPAEAALAASAEAAAAPPPDAATAPTVPAVAAVAAADLGPVAGPILAGRAAEGRQRWLEKADDLGKGLPEEQRQVVTVQLEALAGMDRHLQASLKADVGKTVEIELAKEKLTGELREVTPESIRVMQTVALGQGTGKALRTVPLADFSIAERLRRLGPGETPELALQRGLLALQAGRTDTARKLFEKAGGPLGGALVAELDSRRAARREEARAEAAEQAVVELLRQISTSPRLGDRDKVIAAVRKRCEGDPKRVQAARMALAEFGKEWGETEAGKEWAPVVQEALAAFYPCPGKAWTVPELGLEMVWVAPGSFQMGCADNIDYEKPVHEVRISRGFWLGKCELTQTEYATITKGNPSTVKGARNPVETVLWRAASAFGERLTSREQDAMRLPAGYEYRLPTEAEWEYAARGGDRSKGYVYAGSDLLDEVAWHPENSGGRPQTVGQKQANELGLHDMTGNVNEWCLDWFEETYYARSPAVDPVNTQPTDIRVARGGGGGYGGWFLRSVGRGKFGAEAEYPAVGFRVCLGPVLPAAAP